MPNHLVPKLITSQSPLTAQGDIAAEGINPQLAVLCTVSRKDQIKACLSSRTDLPARATVARADLTLLKRLMPHRIRHRPTMATALIQLLALRHLSLERRIGLRTRRLIRRLQRRAIECPNLELIKVHPLEAAHLRTREHADPPSVPEMEHAH